MSASLRILVCLGHVLCRPLWFAIVAALFVAAALSSGSQSALHADPLQGTWETSSVPVRTLRATLVRSGYSAAQITSFLKFFGMKNAWRTGCSFTTRVVRRLWQ